MLILLLACKEPGTLDGMVRERRTGEPVATTVRLEADARGDCAVKEGKSGEDGSFVVPGLCPRERYRVTLPEEGLRLEAAVEVDGEVPGTVTLEPWRVPTSEGVFLLDRGRFAQLTTQSGVDKVELLGKEVRFPLELPERVPQIDRDTLLVLNAVSLRFVPLLPADGRDFGTAELPVRFGPWHYLGARFGEGGVESVEATPAAEGTTTVGEVHFLDGRAFPKGRMALYNGDESRVFFFDFAGG